MLPSSPIARIDYMWAEPHAAWYKSKNVKLDKEVLCGTYFSILTFIRTYELIKWEYRLVQFSLAPIFFDQWFRFLLFSLCTRKRNSFYWNIIHLGLLQRKFVWFDISRKSQGHLYSATLCDIESGLILIKRRLLTKNHVIERIGY